jgi:hypothetical protein
MVSVLLRGGIGDYSFCNYIGWTAFRALMKPGLNREVEYILFRTELSESALLASLALPFP